MRPLKNMPKPHDDRRCPRIVATLKNEGVISQIQRDIEINNKRTQRERRGLEQSFRMFKK